MVSPTPKAVVSALLAGPTAPERVVELLMAGVAIGVRVTLVTPVRPSLPNVPDSEPARLMSAPVPVSRWNLPPTIVAVPPEAALIWVRTSPIVPLARPIDRLLPASEPVVPLPAWNVIVLLLTIR